MYICWQNLQDLQICGGEGVGDGGVASWYESPFQSDKAVARVLMFCLFVFPARCWATAM